VQELDRVRINCTSGTVSECRVPGDNCMPGQLVLRAISRGPHLCKSKHGIDARTRSLLYICHTFFVFIYFPLSPESAEMRTGDVTKADRIDGGYLDEQVDDQVNDKPASFLMVKVYSVLTVAGLGVGIAVFLVIALATVGYQALCAATVNPVKNLTIE
jgi:hypothetical protein